MMIGQVGFMHSISTYGQIVLVSSTDCASLNYGLAEDTVAPGKRNFKGKGFFASHLALSCYREKGVELTNDNP